MDVKNKENNSIMAGVPFECPMITLRARIQLSPSLPFVRQTTFPLPPLCTPATQAMINYVWGTLGFAVLRCWTIFLAYFGNCILELRYWGILQTSGMRFCGILDGIKKILLQVLQRFPSLFQFLIVSFLVNNNYY